MTYHNKLINEPKQWNNKCPICSSPIKWSLSASRPGAKAVAYCSKSPNSSRVEIKNLRETRICMWQGFVIRQPDGGIRFKEKNGGWIRQEHY